MKNKILILFFIGSMAFYSCSTNLFGCLEGSGEIVTKTIGIDDIEGFELAITAEVFVSESATQEITIEGFENIVDAIANESKVDNEIWKIDVNGCSTTGGTKIFIKIPKLENIELSNAGFIRSEGIFNNVDDLKIKSNDAGQIELEIGDADEVTVESNDAGKIDLKMGKAREVSIESNDAGFITIEGITQNLNIEMNDVGDVFLHELLSTDCQFETNGQGDLQVFVTDKLDGEINDQGSVCYKGMPTINVEINDQGSLIDCN